MSTRLFTKEEVIDLIYNSTVEEIEVDQGRWSQYTDNVVRTDDDRFYLISWERGLTENQEDIFFEGEYPEVFPVEGVSGVLTHTRYVTEPTPYDHSEDAESVRLLGADENYREAAQSVTNEDIDEIMEIMERLSVFDQFGSPVTNCVLRFAAEAYFERMRDAIEHFG